MWSSWWLHCCTRSLISLWIISSIMSNKFQPNPDIDNVLMGGSGADKQLDKECCRPLHQYSQSNWADFSAHFSQLKNFKISSGTAYSWNQLGNYWFSSSLWVLDSTNAMQQPQAGQKAFVSPLLSCRLCPELWSQHYHLRHSPFIPVKEEVVISWSRNQTRWSLTISNNTPLNAWWSVMANIGWVLAIIVRHWIYIYK